MGRMKDYLLFCEEKGYVEWDESQDTYVNTSEHPGENQAIAEYLEELKNGTS
jgi:hypothetical protein